jgi:hypothetical protein
VLHTNYSGDQIKKDVSGEASGTCWREGNCIQVGNLKGGNHFEDRDVDGSIIYSGSSRSRIADCGLD